MFHRSSFSIIIIITTTTLFTIDQVYAFNVTFESKSIDTDASCIGATNLEHFTGYCMFHYECVQKQGVSIGPCFTNHIVASCCMVPKIQSKRIKTNTGHNKLTSLLVAQSKRKPFLSRLSTTVPPVLDNRKNPIKSTTNNSRWSSMFGGGAGPTTTTTTTSPSSTSSTINVNKTAPIDQFNYNVIISANNRKTTNKPTSLITSSTIHSVGTVQNQLATATVAIDGSFNELPLNVHIEVDSNHTAPNTTVDFTESIMTVTISSISTSTTTDKTSDYENKPHCGIRHIRPTGRVVGGRNSQFGEWPWQVLIKESTWLGFFMKVKCGGVLIHHKWVLTAAHCQPGMMGSLIVMLGQHELNGHAQQIKPLVKTVRRMIVHRDYNPDTFENDIALLELDAPFENQPHVVPICLPDQEEDYVSKYAYVTGWGKLSYGGMMPNILQTVRLPIIANNVCQKMFADAGHFKTIRNTFLCAGYPQGGKDTCEGDSGGPLMMAHNGVWSLIGTVSHGIKCAEPNMPGVYMKTFAYLNWIKGIIGHI